MLPTHVSTSVFTYVSWTILNLKYNFRALTKMLKVVAGLLQEVWQLFIEMSPWLLLGFMVAGFLHVMMPREKIYQHFSGSNIL